MSEKAAKLLEGMRRSADNWTPNDLRRLYEGFGFDFRHGSRHDVVVHSVYKELRATIPRHSSLAKGYITHAVKLIDELQRREREIK